MKFPKFKLEDQQGNTITNKDLGEWSIIYLYPKDNTSGCTIEAKDFTQLLPKFKKLNAKVFGLSPDSKESHCKFIDKQELKLQLLSDPEKQLLQALDCWIEKSMYGRKYMGVNRSTFLVKNNEIIHEWRKVKVPSHANEVLEILKKYQQSS